MIFLRLRCWPNNRNSNQGVVALSLEKWKPAVSKYWLMVLAGLMWTVVGIMLCRLAYIWLKAVPWSRALPLGSLGLVFALAAFHFYDAPRHHIALLAVPQTFSRRHLRHHRRRIVPFELSLLPAYLEGKNQEAVVHIV